MAPQRGHALGCRDERHAHVCQRDTVNNDHRRNGGNDHTAPAQDDRLERFARDRERLAELGGDAESPLDLPWHRYGRVANRWLIGWPPYDEEPRSACAVRKAKAEVREREDPKRNSDP